MTKSAVINIRAKPETKRAVEDLFSQFDITVSDAVNMFFNKALMEGGLPFDVRLSAKQHSAAVHPMLPSGMNEVLQEGARKIFGKALREIRLYGSYARGEATGESDIDVALLVEMSRNKLAAARGEVAMLADDLSLEFGRVISLHCIPATDFAAWSDSLPYYQIIENEGVVLYA